MNGWGTQPGRNFEHRAHRHDREGTRVPKSDTHLARKLDEPIPALSDDVILQAQYSVVEAGRAVHATHSVIREVLEMLGIGNNDE